MVITVAAGSSAEAASAAADQCSAPASWKLWKHETPPLRGVDVNYLRLAADGTFYWNNIAITPRNTAEQNVAQLLRIVGYIKNAQMVLDRGDAGCGTFTAAVELMNKAPLCAAGRCWVGKSPDKIFIAVPPPVPRSR